MAKKGVIALSQEIESKKILELQDRIDTNSRLLDDIVNRLVSEYCKPLDDYVAFIKSVLEDTNNPPTDLELDDFILNLPVLLYFTGEALESLGIREDIAKAIRQELYNKAFDNATGTIADKTAEAELAVQNEQITQITYQRAYRKVKLRMEAGYELLQSIKKVITRRGQEYEMSRIDPARIGGQ